MKTYIPARMKYPNIFIEYESGTHEFTLDQNVRCELVMVGAGGFSFATYSGDAASSGKPGWCGKECILGGAGGLIHLDVILPKGNYRVQIGVLGGGTDTKTTSYPKMKKPTATQGDKPLETCLYKDGELIMIAYGGKPYGYKQSGNQKNDGARYVATSTNPETNGEGGSFEILDESLSIFENNSVQGQKGLIKASSGSITTSMDGTYKGWGKPNQISAQYVEAYSIKYTASGGTGGYFKIDSEVPNIKEGKIVINPFCIRSSKGTYSIVRK